MEQPQGDSESGLLERLGNALVPDAGAPEPQAIEASQEVEADEQPQEGEQPADDGFVDLELEDGETVRVPPKLKDGYLRQSDYTRKTQDLASLQKQAQATLEQQQMRAQFEQFVSEDRERLSGLKTQLDQYKKLDWSNLSTEDYIRYKGAMDQLRDQASDLEKSIQGKEQQFQGHLAQHRRQAAANAYDFIGRHVKGFGPDSEIERSVANYAAQNGLPHEAFAQGALTFPSLAVMAYKAMQFDQLQSTKPQALAKAKAAPPVVKPGSMQAGTTHAQIVAKQARASLKKTGSLQDAARVFASRMK